MRTRAALSSAWVMILCRIAFAEPSGSMRGRVTDGETLEPLVGADVVLASPALQGERTTVTIDDGRFLLTGLPPGVYTARFAFATITTERTGIRVRAGRRVIVNAQLSSSRFQLPTEEPVYLVDEATGVGTHVDAALIAHLPHRTRNFAETFDLMPTAWAKTTGPVVAVDNLSVADPAFRTLGTRLVLEFVAELELREGGWNAELGRSTDGFLEVATKSGSNRLSGSVFTTVWPGALGGNPAYPRADGAWLVERGRTSVYATTGFELGGALITDRLWFHVGYAPEILSQRWTRRVRRGTAGDDLLDPSDNDGDGFTHEPNGIPDGLRLDPWGRAVTRPASDGDTEWSSLAVAHHFHGKLTHRINDHSSHTLTLFGAPTEFDGVVEDPFDPRSPHASLNGEEDGFQFDGFTGNLSGVYNYAGTFMGDRLGVDVTLGWHHQERRYALKQTTDAPLVVFAEPRALAAVGSAPPSCATGELFDDGSQPCMVADYAVGGFGGGALASELLNRWSQRAAVTHRFVLAGHHEVKAGLDFEQTGYQSRRDLPGGGSYRYERTAARLVGDELLRDGEMRARASARTLSLDFAAFLQDSWTPAHEVTLNYGLRWQGQQLYAPVPGDRGRLERVVGLYDGVAPRLGAAWDFLGDGRSRLFAHWGRYLAPIPLRVADRTFGGIEARPIEYDSTTCTSETGAPIAAVDVTRPAEQCVARSTPGARLRGVAAPGLEGEHSDALLAGLEIEPWPSWSFSVTGTWQSLGQAVAEVVTDDGRVLANPGDFDARRRLQLDEAIAVTRDADERAAMIGLGNAAEAIHELPRAERERWGLRFVVDKRFMDRLALRASYFLSWTGGNTLGSPADPIATPMSRGPLPTDRRHRIQLDGYTVFDAHDAGVPWVTTLGATARVMSGGPIDVLAVDPTTGAATHLLPRGEGGRTPWVWSVDLHLASRYHFDPRFALELFVEVFNLFNRREPIAVVSAYTYDRAEPIPNGTIDDLDHARAIDGQPVRKNPTYGEPLVFQQPFGASLGARLLF